MEPDPRFLRRAAKVLPSRGKVDIYGRTNTLRDHFRAQLPERPTKSQVPDKAQRRAAAKKRTALLSEINRKYPETNENPYLNINPEQLQQLAKQTGYKGRVKRAKQPSRTVPGGDPDTRRRAGNTRSHGLQPFTTRFTFTRAPGWRSRPGSPRVSYASSEASDWEEDA